MRERAKRVTLRDVAQESGLSTAAVSYALRGLQVPPETQARVREVADRLGYQVDPIARALASGRTGYVGVLCGSLSDIWQQNVAAALGRGLLEHDRHALIVDASNSPELEKELANQLVDQRVDALIVLWANPHAPHWPDIARRTVLVSIGDGLPGAATAVEIVFDNDVGVQAALGRLAEAGHEHVAVLTPSDRNTPDTPAEGAIRRVAGDLGLAIDLHMTPYDLDGATAVARDVLSRPVVPTALFCLADAMAYGVYAAARDLGLRIPEDVSVLGYDDDPVSRLLTPPLSNFRWPVDELVSYAVERTVRAVAEGRHSRRKLLTPIEQPRGSVTTRR
ncbi:transcriptional regulator, LacI family [Jatrophihabitans endophyticus]|uniref:Transcriptional regulator, LacI family n=1 Tax=Jatrophihabitans endophyticus TaxID=1206085 RepID=A0A1M5QA52_9ACTN|nr:LacI family DNA-binding transcriptional regulator [Jatrophihabitans endophyticus]SHH10848.1 transcriptional regulator, LacI family [Jatrophihabitans endophyticus]